MKPNPDDAPAPSTPSFTCPCGAAFESASALMSHQQTAHGG